MGKYLTPFIFLIAHCTLFAQYKGKLLVADATYGTISFIDLSNKKSQILVETLRFPWRLDFDHRQRKIYWTDVDKNFIQRANEDGTNIDTLYQWTYPQGLAIDPESNTLYVAETGTPLILKGVMDGKDQLDTLIENYDLLTDPDDIELDPENGKLYWIDVVEGTIMRANTDGSQLEKFMKLNSPQAIELDPKGGKIYWADSGTGKIQRANLNKTKVEDLMTDLKSPTGLAVDFSEKKIYWADVKEKKVYAADLQGNNMVVLMEDLGDFHIALQLVKTSVSK